MKTHFKIGWSLTTLLLVASCINESVDNLQTNQSEEDSSELYAIDNAWIYGFNVGVLYLDGLKEPIIMI